ncbi:hypothetical protein RJT34_03247 [Clitoria ternatea]|uniref:Uncharacterized protein n=1 Tax=Clitoria ternatea TaxID=43366 RepID=A0AAN9Q2D3_CLITE
MVPSADFGWTSRSCLGHVYKSTSRASNRLGAQINSQHLGRHLHVRKLYTGIHAGGFSCSSITLLSRIRL